MGGLANRLVGGIVGGIVGGLASCLVGGLEDRAYPAADSAETAYIQSIHVEQREWFVRGCALVYACVRFGSQAEG